MRAALAMQPTYETVAAGQDAYVNNLTMKQLAREYGRYWMFHSTPTTVALPNGCFAKALTPFLSHATEPEFRELLKEYSDCGVPRPNGYADVFHERFTAPRVNWSINSRLWPLFAGGWQAAIPGNHTGEFYRYDMRSAYLWSATIGMPNVKSYARSCQPWRERKGKHGVYRIVLLGADTVAPFPFNRASECLATTEEIDTYGLRIGQVIDGVTWDSLIPGDEIVSALQTTSTWKLAARAYWGRWAQSGRVECVAKGKSWFLPNVTLNIPWAHMIVSRVKLRLWKAATNAVHVFVDSVITPHVLETGPNLGDWRLEKAYWHGVIIRAPGQYGDAATGYMEKMSGVPVGSAKRDMETLTHLA